MSLFTSHVKGLWKNNVYPDQQLHGKQIVSVTALRYSQYSLVNMIENRKNTLDNNGFVARISMDLSNAFDTLNHNLLIAKFGLMDFGEDT